MYSKPPGLICTTGLRFENLPASTADRGAPAGGPIWEARTVRSTHRGMHAVLPRFGSACIDRARMSPMGLWVDYRSRTWASVAILTTALASTPAYAADGVGVCGTFRLAETAVAMLDNQPIVKVFANSATVLLLLDTGAEATVLTPAAAQRIGAQQARVKLGRQMHGITGDIPASE